MEIELRNDYIVGLFGSVTYERQKQNVKKQDLLPAQNKADEAERARELEEKLKGVRVTISPESRVLFERMRKEKNMSGPAPESVQDSTRRESVFDRGDPFAPKEQWEMQYTVFTKALAEMGFYDDMTDEEVLKTENLLVDITHTMNQLCGYFKCESLDGEKVSVSSYAAKMELESSAAALRQFAEKCLPNEMRARFEKLTEQYYEHNAKALAGYRSAEEIANESEAKLLERTASSPERARPVSESAQVRWAAAKAAVKDEDEKNAIAAWRDCFLRFGSSLDHDRLTEEMNAVLMRYASGGSSDQKLLTYLEQWNRPIVENAKAYWSAISDMPRAVS